MDQRIEASLKAVLILIVEACVFGVGTLWGLYLCFHQGSEFIAEEMARRNMDFTPMAAYLNDGGEIYQGEGIITILDLNQATREQLAKIPGLNEELASAIVDFRDQYGRFNEVTDLQLVEGISYTLCLQLEPYLIVKQEIE